MVILFGFLDIVFSIGVITILFAAIFKILTDVKIRWRDVWGEFTNVSTTNHKIKPTLLLLHITTLNQGRYLPSRHAFKNAELVIR